MNTLPLRFLTVIFSLIPTIAVAQDVDTLKSGVVRVTNTYTQQVGTGFIIRIDNERAYVMTASHVVKGNQHPNIYLYNRQSEPVEGTLAYREDDDQKGLALIELKAKRETLAGIVPVKLRSSSDLKGGEEMRVIGFPDGVIFWTVFIANVSRLEGRNLVFSGPIKAGNSGSPLFYDGKVVGLVTDADPNSVYAVRTEGLIDYLRGVNNKLAESVTPQPATAPNSNGDKSEFCQALTRIVDSSREGFYDIIKQGYESAVLLPGFSTSLVSPETQSASFSSFTSDSSKALDQYYALIANTKKCLSDWKQIDPNKLRRLHKINAPMSFIFMHSDQTLVSLQHSAIADSDNYIVQFNVYAAGSNRGTFSGINDAILALAFTESEGERDSVCRNFETLVQASHQGFSSMVGKPYSIGYFEASFRIPGFPSIKVKPREEAYMIFRAEDLNEVQALNDRFAGLLTKCFPAWTPTDVKQSTYNPSTRRFRLKENSDMGSAFELWYNSQYEGAHSFHMYLYTPDSARRLR